MNDIFDKVKLGLKKASVKSATLIEVTRVKSDIYNLKKRKQAIFTEVGEKIYHMHKEDQVDVGKLSHYWSQIASYDVSIIEKEMEIQRLENEKEANIRRYNEEYTDTEEHHCCGKNDCCHDHDNQPKEYSEHEVEEESTN